MLIIKNYMTQKKKKKADPGLSTAIPMLRFTADTPEQIGQLIADPPRLQDGRTTKVRVGGSI